MTWATVEFEVDGQTYRATVLRVHKQGARLETESRAPVGSMIRIGRITAQVVELLPDGIVVKFVDIVG